MRMLGLIALALLSGCVSQPPVSESSPESSLAPAAKVAVADATPVAMSAGEEKEFVPPPGYKERLEGGKRYYCAKITVLGSRFPKDDCRTQAELEEIEFQKGSMRGSMGQRSGTCTSAAGCANP